MAYAMIATTLFLALFFLVGSTLLTSIGASLNKLGRFQAGEELKAHSVSFFYQHIAKKIFGNRTWEGIFFSTTCTQQMLQICYAIASVFFLLSLPDVQGVAIGYLAFIMAAILLGIWFALDLSFRLLAEQFPRASLSLCGFVGSIFLSLCAPFSYLSLKLRGQFFQSSHQERGRFATGKIRDKILEIIQESDLAAHLDQQDQRLLVSMASFKERIAREVMVPRIDVFSLSSETSVAEAVHSFVKEGYSRIPVYKDSVDHVIGVLLYKDLLNIYALNAMQVKSTMKLNSPIEGLVKPVLYTPETKKISHLLQEFRSKQIHLAIVVDEYGGTEGIVTIEDILEELVGEIADEYDVGEEKMYAPLPEGGWVVDARMGILDIEKELGVKLPTSPEYDTIGGYIFHRAGAIPSQGWRIHHDDFYLEVLCSDERSIEKIKILPHKEEES